MSRPPVTAPDAALRPAGESAAATARTAARTPRQPKPPGIRQTMSDLHIWTGLLVGWILYALSLIHI